MKPILSPWTIIKVWILIYLCDMSKALHIEVVDSMTSSELLMLLDHTLLLGIPLLKFLVILGNVFCGSKNYNAKGV